MKKLILLFLLISIGANCQKLKDYEQLRQTQTSNVVDTTDPVAGTLTYSNVTETTVDFTLPSTDDIGVARFEIYVNSTYNSTVYNSTLVNYTLSGLTANTAYSVYIMPYDSANNSDTSNTVSFTTLANQGNAPPLISNLRVENTDTDRIYFDATHDVTGWTKQGLTISQNIPISSITIDGDGLGGYITLDEADFTFWDNNTLRLEGGDGTVEDFTLSYIENNIVEPVAPTFRYVTTTGLSTNDGLSEANAWSIEHALTSSVAGMTIWIKAGDYGNKNITIPNDGTPTSPIKFIGYKTAIDDITTNYYDYGITMSTAEMPTLIGNDPDSGNAITFNDVENVIVKNIQVNNYQYGFYAKQKDNNNIVLQNVNGLLFGDAEEDASFIDFEKLVFGTPTTDKTQWTFVGNTNIKVIDAVSINASMGGLILYGDGGNLMDGVKIYNDRVVDGGSTPWRQDYAIAFNGHNSINRNCYAENFNSTTL